VSVFQLAKPSSETNGRKLVRNVTASNIANPVKSSDISPTESQQTESEQVVEAEADENDELLKGVKAKDDNSPDDNEEGEVDKNVRNLTDDEQSLLGKALGADWKKLALKLGFTADEVGLQTIYFSAVCKIFVIINSGKIF